jgi:CBS domain-containing protein
MNFTLKDVLLSAKKNPVISIEAHEPLGRALHLFQEHSISSLAVYGAPGSYYSSADITLSIHNGKQYIGLLSLADCVSFLLTEGKHVEISVLQAIGATNESMSLWILKTSDSLFSSLEPLGKGLHSFLVATPNEQEPLYLLSQQDILLFLHEQLLDENFYDRFPMDLKSFCKDKSQLVVAQLGDSIQDVLKTMTTLAFRSVGVVDKFGSLVDYFSFSGIYL